MWFLLPLLFLGQGVGALLSVVALFGIVFLHELGHCLAARHFGIQVLDITFWPLGGMARMSELPEDPKIEGVIAAAGPMVNFALAAITLPLLIGFEMSGFGLLVNPLQWFLVVNLMLGGFNLIPAFPMDGGRILRAFLGRTHDWVTATEMAVKTSRIAIIVMVLLALLYAPKATVCMMPFLAGFIWFAGARELWAIRIKHGYSPLGGMEGTSPFGSGSPQEAWAQAEPGPTHAHPPVETEVFPERQPGQGFSESDLKRLEGFHGRLRRRPPSDD